MSSAKLTRDTVYKQYIRERVGQGCNETKEFYTYESLAALVGLKPTHNFRRRVREMVSEGLLEVNTVFSPRGGLMHVFGAKIPDISGVEF